VTGPTELRAGAGNGVGRGKVPAGPESRRQSPDETAGLLAHALKPQRRFKSATRHFVAVVKIEMRR
jgi:hypothetical protein